jgi:hypothetical protein
MIMANLIGIVRGAILQDKDTQDLEAGTETGYGYIGARNDTTQQSGQTLYKEADIKNITVYVSGYTVTDPTGVLSPQTLWRQQSEFCFQPTVWPDTCCSVHRNRVLLQLTKRISTILSAHITAYVSGYTETDKTAVLSPPTLWLQQSEFVSSLQSGQTPAAVCIGFECCCNGQNVSHGTC